MMRSKVKAELLYYDRLVFENGWLRSEVIWRLPISIQYPEGWRYRLVLVDRATGAVILLFDNHYPKGHHQHLKDGSEVEYAFKTLEKLMDDFLAAIQVEFSQLGPKEK